MRLVQDIDPGDSGFPAGWVLLEGSLVNPRSRVVGALCYDVGEGFSDSQSISVPVSRIGTIQELVCLPTGVKRLRWQIAGIVKEAGQPPRIRQVGVIERLARMMRRVVSIYTSQPPERRRAVGLSVWQMLFDLRGAYSVAGKLRGYSSISYRDWIERFDLVTDEDRDKIRRHIDRFAVRPLFSLVVPVVAGDRERLGASLKSLSEQLYQYFEIIILDAREKPDDSGSLGLNAVQAARVRIVGPAAAPHLWDELCGNTNPGEAKQFIALVHEGDQLAEHALYWFAAELQRRPDAALLYSDSDGLDSKGTRVEPCFKPDWSTELLRSTNYLGGMVVFRAGALRGVDGISSKILTGGGHDLALRMAESVRDEDVVHLPAVLYHRGADRADASSRSSIKAVEEHLARQDIVATVAETRPDCFRIRYAISGRAPLASVLIPTRDAVGLLRQCVESVLSKTTYRNFEVIVVDNQSRDAEALDYLESLEARQHVKVLRFDRPFNFSAINNCASRHARGEVLCLLNNDTEVITPDWMEEMLGHLVQSHVGVVGAKLFYPDGRVQHAGDAVGPAGCADHMHSMIDRDDPGYCNRAILAQDVSAVTGACLVTWKSLYEQLGGFDETHLKVAFNDVDYCLRVREAGFRVIWTPHAELYHHESVSRGRDVSETARRRTRREADYMRSRWRHVMRHDPFYNPNLSYEKPDFALSITPTVKRPWL
jgi:GT2 family glycosyltransferase